jgi:hypothetical protein
MLLNRNCFKVLVKMISASPIARLSVIQILDDADAAFRILGAGLRTVLSATTMFADKPHRLNGRMRAARLCFDDLASGTALAVGLPAQRAIAQRFRALARSRHVKRAEQRPFIGLQRTSENDPGCLKTSCLL